MERVTIKYVEMSHEKEEEENEKTRTQIYYSLLTSQFLKPLGHQQFSITHSKQFSTLIPSCIWMK